MRHFRIFGDDVAGSRDRINSGERWQSKIKPIRSHYSQLQFLKHLESARARTDFESDKMLWLTGIFLISIISMKLQIY